VRTHTGSDRKCLPQVRIGCHYAEEPTRGVASAAHEQSEARGAPRERIEHIFIDGLGLIDQKCRRRSDLVRGRQRQGVVKGGAARWLIRARQEFKQG